jgi:hypothetical protein
MDRLTALQDAIDRTQQAANRYPQPAVFEIHGRDILTGHQEGWTQGALQRHLLDIADDHSGCILTGCRTCEAIAASLTESLRQMYSLQVIELEASVAPARSWWRNTVDRWVTNR